jgi:repressor of nif and glnA expression
MFGGRPKNRRRNKGLFRFIIKKALAAEHNVAKTAHHSTRMLTMPMKLRIGLLVSGGDTLIGGLKKNNISIHFCPYQFLLKKLPK